MNAAFAIGRLLDMRPGKERLLNLPDTEKMVKMTKFFRYTFSKDNFVDTLDQQLSFEFVIIGYRLTLKL